MTDPTTPTDQPDELDAIRARWRGEVIRPEQYGWTEIRNGVWTHPEIFGGKLECDYPHVQLVQDSADIGTLREMLDERNEEEKKREENLSKIGNVLSDSFIDLHEKINSQNSEIELLRRELAEYEKKFEFVKAELLGDANFGELVSVLWDKPAVESAMKISSLERQLAEAREKALEEIAKFYITLSMKRQLEGDTNSADTFLDVAKTIRSLKPQPNQKDTQ